MRELKIPYEAAEACVRILAQENAYPGLHMGGNRASYELLKADMELVASTLGEIFLALTDKKMEVYVKEARHRDN